jgi:hypothetical protein
MAASDGQTGERDILSCRSMCDLAIISLNTSTYFDPLASKANCESDFVVCVTFFKNSNKKNSCAIYNQQYSYYLF